MLIRSDQTTTLDYWQKEQVYNCTDTTVTLEANEAMQPLRDEAVDWAYSFSMQIRHPYMAMMRRGILVDEEARTQCIDKYSRDQDKTRYYFETISEAVCGQPYTYNKTPSPQVLKKILYDFMKIKPVKKRDPRTKEMKPTTNREALEQICHEYKYAQPICNAALAARDCSKKLEVLKTGVSDDGRLRCSFGPQVLETGRSNSTPNPEGDGLSFHTITNEIRRICIADEGCKLAYVDLQSAESYGVAVFSKDQNYFDAVKSGDVHTAVARIIWPELQWTGEPSKDRSVADQIYYGRYSYRDMAKRGGHATNYLASPWTLASALKIPIELAIKFQETYFSRFPRIKTYHEEVRSKICSNSETTNPLGRRRTFWGHKTADKTLKEAVANDSQSLISDILDMGLLNFWNNLDDNLPCWLLATMHDAILILYHEDSEHEVLGQTIDCLEIPLTINGFDFKIPADAECGWNWAKADPKNKIFADGNPGGLMGWTSNEARRRNSKLARTVRSIYV